MGERKGCVSIDQAVTVVHTVIDWRCVEARMEAINRLEFAIVKGDTRGEGATLFQARVSLASSKRDFLPARTLKLLMTMSKFR